MPSLLNTPRGFVSGTGVITRADGSKVPFEFKSEDMVSEDSFKEACGANPAAVVTPPEGEG